MNATMQFLCWAANLPGPPTTNFQGLTIATMTPDRTLCPPIDPTRDVIFHLYTQDNIETSQVLKIDDDKSISSSNINFSNPTVLFFHGFMETYESKDAQLLKDALLKKGPNNVILVDQKRLLAGFNYIAASNNAKAIGEFSAKLVQILIKKGLNLEDLIVVGHSLGAQTAHYLGKHVKLPRIVAQDPAGPIFELLPNDAHLNKDSADFVLAIRTNAGVNGFLKDCGDVDVYVNGKAVFQPNCKLTDLVMDSLSMSSLSEMASDGILNIPLLIFCSHWLSWEMTVISVNDPTAFPARKCDSFANYKAGKCDSNDLQYVSLYMDSSASGRYYLETSSEYPYKLESSK